MTEIQQDSVKKWTVEKEVFLFLQIEWTPETLKLNQQTHMVSEISLLGESQSLDSQLEEIFQD